MAFPVRLIAPFSLAVGGLLLIAISSPPWFNMLFGEEYSTWWPGVAVGIAQVVIAAGMARVGRAVTAIGLAVSAAAWLVAMLLIVMVQASAPVQVAAAASRAALYALVIVATAVEARTAVA